MAANDFDFISYIPGSLLNNISGFEFKVRVHSPELPGYLTGILGFKNIADYNPFSGSVHRLSLDSENSDLQSGKTVSIELIERIGDRDSESKNDVWRNYMIMGTVIKLNL